jgi:acyl-coenzyme A thioesterase PaaI-like protein
MDTAVEAQIQEFVRQACPLYRSADLSIESVRDGIYRCRVPLNEHNGNHLNTMHAAIQWASAEILGGLVAGVSLDFDLRFFVAVRSVSIEFLRPARTAITAEARFTEQESAQIKSQATAGSNTTFRLSAVIRNESGETVATTEADYVVRPARTA